MPVMLTLGSISDTCDLPGGCVGEFDGLYVVSMTKHVFLAIVGKLSGKSVPSSVKGTSGLLALDQGTGSGCHRQALRPL
jgi:hypothetical protein